ncbi:hypothetical protein PQR71_40205 [Paraburkholderia fungorum]|uniref:glycine-rich domain-containing protein n=1 Tax=Paraburkholderia fungorum TaxID=134537 RepID=UPI0038B92622
MLKRISLFIVTALLSCAAFGQSAPGFTYGQVPTAGQWNSYFANKLDYNPAGLPINLGGTGAATVAQAQVNLGLSPGSNVQPYSPILSQIAAGTWTGATSITTLGTITAGVWQGTPIGSNYGGAGAIMGALRGNGSGVVTQAACSDLSNATTACSTSIGTASGDIPILGTGGALPSSTLPILTGDVTSTAGSSATTVAAIDGHPVSLSGSTYSFAGTLTANTAVAFPHSGTLVGSADTGTVTSTMMTATGVGAGSCTSCSLTYDASGRIFVAANGAGGAASLTRSTHTAAYTASISDKSSVLYATGAWTLTLTAPATLGNGWWAIVQNAGTGNITLSLASGTIDGLSSYVMYPGETRIINTDGTNFYSVVLNPLSLRLLTTTTITIPPGYAGFKGILWGGGGGGFSGTGSANIGGGGGGGAAVPFEVASLVTPGATITCTVAGAAAAGINGNSSTLGSLFTAFGGAAGAANLGGGGGGALSAGSSSAGGTPGIGSPSVGAPGLGGANAGISSAWGGAGGGNTSAGANSVYGGAGGGSPLNATTNESGGTSYFGGAGGASALSGTASAGMQPGGGGGGNYSGTGGTGGAGECYINGVI